MRSRLSHVGRRLAGAVGTVLLVSVVVFFLLQLAPGNAADIVVGEDATPQQLDIARAQLGLDRPLIVQYLNWLGGVVHGDFGDSLFTRRSVATGLWEAAPATLSITLLALLLAAVFGVAAGAAAGLGRETWVDRVVSLLATLGIAMPSFWVGLVLVSLFAFKLKWFPATGYAPISDGIGPWLSHIVLPCVALALALSAEVARQARGGVVDVMAKPYMLAARARGANGGWLVRRHVLRNAAIPVVTVFGLQAATLLGGVVVVEQVFAIPGLGSVAIAAVLRHDYPVVQAYVLMVAVVVVVINLIVDTSYGWINPKVRR
ncbi:peptide/nickel transport system permease protein [Antricoccus suffuscus]|uniref:Peptide/nickel transport system permease protein n=1 Tax=Antricoccus suffuscus TaxID=1629062 RepID=A0A2T0ZTS7_9ACTN|nr:ABC transporter permease [Antricoccus suffuscus]PRZ39694.1 peptide/nickel transport system permease protein [Antricoccus suffuscus]